MASDTEIQFDFQALPEVLKLRIFSYFPLPFLTTSVALVCKAWWELSKDPSLWQDIEICCNRVSSGEQYRTIVSRCSMLRELTILPDTENDDCVHHQVSEFSSLTLKVLRMVCASTNQKFWMNLDTKFPCLEELEMKDSYTDDDSDYFFEMIGVLSQLKSLKITTRDSGQYFDDCNLKAIVTAFPRLETLHLDYYFYGGSNECFRHLIHETQNTLKDVRLNGFSLTDKEISCFSLCSGITSLDLTYTEYITDSSFDALEELDLKTLKLNCNCCMTPNVDVTSEALSRFFRSSHRQALRELCLDGLWNLNDDVLKIVSQTCSNITELSICGTKFVSDEGLVACLNVLPKISRLYFRQCPSVSYDILSYSSPAVRVYCD